jgi:peptidoglycan/xylan/chitin deacetylase (PgdA/CDA1 family)
MYHDVVAGDADSSGFPGPGPARYKVSLTTFIRQLDSIGRAVSGPPAVAEDLIAPGAPGTSWSLTFDDGGSAALLAAEELARRRWRAHFFIVTDLIGTPGFADAAAIRALREMGHLVGAHSASHPDRMSSLSFGDVLGEWRTSVAGLADVVGEDIATASVPGGFYKRDVAVAADRAGVAVLFTSEPVRTPRSVGDCLVVGRYAIVRTTSADEAAKAARGESLRWIRQYGAWNLRKPLKAIGGRHYRRIRRAVLALEVKRRS